MEIRQNENRDASAHATGPSKNPLRPTTSVTKDVEDVAPQSGTVPLAPNRNSSSMARNSTGPRTPAGKERSKHNAVKHGIFSSVAILPNESRSEFDSILNGLRSDLQPEGTLEGALVEKLAVLSWRYRRLIIAETAEIQKGAAFLEWDEKERQEKEARETSHSGVLDFDAEIVGLIVRRENPQILERCLELLMELKEELETNGFNSEGDTEILQRLYGNGENQTKTLLDIYRVWLNTAECDDEERKQNGYASVEQCTKNVLKELEKEIRRLEQYKKARTSIKSEKTKLDSLRQNVPDSPQLDRLLRYEANLERAFDRTLTQLERLQRMRLGQSVPPSIKVNLSSS